MSTSASRRLSNTAVTLLAGIGVVATSLAAFDHMASGHTSRPSWATPPTTVSGQPWTTVEPTTPSSTTAVAPTTTVALPSLPTSALFTVDGPSQTRADTAIAVRSLDPCPAPPASSSSSDVAVTVTLEQDAPGRDPFAGVQVLVTADGSWTAQLGVGVPPPGHYVVRALCEARVAGSYQRYFDAYEAVAHDITA